MGGCEGSEEISMVRRYWEESGSSEKDQEIWDGQEEACGLGASAGCGAHGDRQVAVGRRGGDRVESERSPYLGEQLGGTGSRKRSEYPPHF